MIGAVARRTVFWVIDRIKGSEIKQHYNDIKNHDKSCDYDNSKKIEEILMYAKENVPYYENIEEIKLEKFPVVDKYTFKNNGDKMLSREFLGKELHTVYTSGSTGNPMRAVQDANKRKRTIADLLYNHDKIGWGLGEKYIFIRNWSDNYRQGFLKSLKQNVRFIKIAEFNDKKKEELYRYLKKKKNIIIFGYSSSVKDFTEYIIKNNYDLSSGNVKVVVCDSDELKEKDRKRYEKYQKSLEILRAAREKMF